MGYLFALFAWPLAAAWHAVAFTTLWRWYIEDAFNAPPLSIRAAVGMALLFNFALVSARGGEKQENTLTQSWVVAVFGPAVYLGFGWVGLQVFA